MASQFLLVSYVPLLRGTAGQLLDRSGSSELFAALARLPLGAADACLSLEAGGVPHPVLVLDQAEAIADHLVEWAEGNPSAWFRLTLIEHRGRYGVVLFPDVAASLDRLLRARELNGLR